MKKHLRYDMYMLDIGKHPQQDMKDLGISYEHATPQSIGDQWWFWNCSDIPDNLPPYIDYLDITPSEAIGWGLSKEIADKLEGGLK